MLGRLGRTAGHIIDLEARLDASQHDVSRLLTTAIDLVEAGDHLLEASYVGHATNVGNDRARWRAVRDHANAIIEGK